MRRGDNIKALFTIVFYTTLSLFSFLYAQGSVSLVSTVGVPDLSPPDSFDTPPSIVFTAPNQFEVTVYPAEIDSADRSHITLDFELVETLNSPDSVTGKNPLKITFQSLVADSDTVVFVLVNYITTSWNFTVSDTVDTLLLTVTIYDSSSNSISNAPVVVPMSVLLEDNIPATSLSSGERADTLNFSLDTTGFTFNNSAWFDPDGITSLWVQNIYAFKISSGDTDLTLADAKLLHASNMDKDISYKSDKDTTYFLGVPLVANGDSVFLASFGIGTVDTDTFGVFGDVGFINIMTVISDTIVYLYPDTFSTAIATVFTTPNQVKFTATPAELTTQEMDSLIFEFVLRENALTESPARIAIPWSTTVLDSDTVITFSNIIYGIASVDTVDTLDFVTKLKDVYGNIAKMDTQAVPFWINLESTIPVLYHNALWDSTKYFLNPSAKTIINAWADSAEISMLPYHGSHPRGLGGGYTWQLRGLKTLIQIQADSTIDRIVAIFDPGDSSAWRHNMSITETTYNINWSGANVYTDTSIIKGAGIFKPTQLVFESIFTTFEDIRQLFVAANDSFMVRYSYVNAPNDTTDSLLVDTLNTSSAGWNPIADTLAWQGIDDFVLKSRPTGEFTVWFALFIKDSINSFSRQVWETDYDFVPPSEDNSPPNTDIAIASKWDSTGNVRNQIFLDLTPDGIAGSGSDSADANRLRTKITDLSSGDSLVYWTSLPPPDSLVALTGRISHSNGDLAIHIQMEDDSLNLDPTGVKDTVKATSFGGWRWVATDTNLTKGYVATSKARYYISLTDSSITEVDIDSSYELWLEDFVLSNDTVFHYFPDTLFNVSFYLGIMIDSAGDWTYQRAWFHFQVGAAVSWALDATANADNDGQTTETATIGTVHASANLAVVGVFFDPANPGEIVDSVVVEGYQCTFIDSSVIGTSRHASLWYYRDGQGGQSGFPTGANIDAIAYLSAATGDLCVGVATFIGTADSRVLFASDTTMTNGTAHAHTANTQDSSLVVVAHYNGINAATDLSSDATDLFERDTGSEVAVMSYILTGVTAGTKTITHTSSTSQTGAATIGAW